MIAIRVQSIQWGLLRGTLILILTHHQIGVTQTRHRRVPTAKIQVHGRRHQSRVGSFRRSSRTHSNPFTHQSNDAVSGVYSADGHTTTTPDTRLSNDQQHTYQPCHTPFTDTTGTDHPTCSVSNTTFRSPCHNHHRTPQRPRSQTHCNQLTIHHHTHILPPHSITSDNIDP